MSSPVKVRGLQVQPIQLELRQPLETASGSYGRWPMVLLNLRTDGGPVGHSFFHCFQPMVTKPLSSLLQQMARVIEGDRLSPVDLDRKLRGIVRLVGAQG